MCLVCKNGYADYPILKMSNRLAVIQGKVTNSC